MTWNAFKMKRTKGDGLFSLWIRFRDDWTCQVCKWKADETNPADRYYLDACHFFGRGNQSTRFDPDNVISACKRCHTNLLTGHGHAGHQEIMRRILGPDRFDLLWVRGHATGRRPDDLLMQALWYAELVKLGVNPKTGRRLYRALSGPGV